MKVINLFAGPSSGKSTTAAGLFYKMKQQHISVELVNEYAKILVYSNRTDFLAESQDYVFAKQHDMLRRLNGKVQYAIADCPLLLSNAYVPDDFVGKEHFQQFVIEVFNSYNNINIFIERPNQFEETGRVHDLDQSIQKDQEIQQIMRDCGCDYTMIKADENIVDNIFDYVINTEQHTVNEE